MWVVKYPTVTNEKWVCGSTGTVESLYQYSIVIVVEIDPESCEDDNNQEFDVPLRPHLVQAPHRHQFVLYRVM